MILTLAGKFQRLYHMNTWKFSAVFNRIRTHDLFCAVPHQLRNKATKMTVTGQSVGLVVPVKGMMTERNVCEGWSNPVEDTRIFSPQFDLGCNCRSDCSIILLVYLRYTMCFLAIVQASYKSATFRAIPFITFRAIPFISF